MKIIRLSQASRVIHSPKLDAFLAMGAPTSRVPYLFEALNILRAIGLTGDVTPYRTTAHAPYLQIIVSLRSLITASTPVGIRQLIQPFVPIMDELVALGYSPSSIGQSDLFTDLSEIITLVTSGKGYGTRAQQYPMFQELFSKFTNELANAASASGNTALEGAIRNNGLLDPSKIVNVFQLGKPLPHMYSVSRKLISSIMSERYDLATYPKYVNQNFQIIKEQLMQHVGVIGAKQQEQMDAERKKEEMERIKDPSLFAPGAPPPSTSIEEAKSYAVTDQQLTNKFFTMSMIVFFTEYAKAIQSLPS